jgi:hypothetical protein
MSIATLTIEDAAKEAAGNWRKWECFAWRDKPENPEQWVIVYTHNRDSGLLDQSNAAAIEKALKPFIRRGDVRVESHGHPLCGHIDGFSIRVNKRCGITKAFRTYFELQERLANYPILDETDYSQREYDATIANFADAAWRVKDEYALPDDWAQTVFSWFWDHDQSAVENRDDQGGYPTEDQLRAAFDDLRWERV